MITNNAASRVVKIVGQDMVHPKITEKRTLTIVENCINAIKLQNMRILASYLGKDILFMVHKADRNKLLYVGIEKFFAGIGQLCGILQNDSANIVWVIEDHKVAQLVIAPLKEARNAIAQAIVYTTEKDKIKKVTLFYGNTIPNTYRTITQNLSIYEK
ncbi:hypothetical protein [Maribacter sp. 2-571]|uniref:hypothetical protein n=1 Tax=Maribacter sp. 2-571 TaxID=3417569 RepID=UPI003D3256D4